jgi:hypothetical protein
MSSWGNNDNSANAPYWAVNSTIVNATNVKNNYSAPTADNVALLYANTTADVYTVGETIGLFMVDQNEQDVQETLGTPPAHKGWNLKTTGSGGRAGRVTWETLVALSTVASDNSSDDTVLPDAIITITSQPATAQTVSFSSANTVTFAVAAAITSGATNAPLSYQWQVNGNFNGSTWVNITPGTGVTTGQPGDVTKTGANTASLVLDPTANTANNYVFRCVVSNSDAGAIAYSANGRLLITA